MKWMIRSILSIVAVSLVSPAACALEVLADNLAASTFGFQVSNNDTWLAQEFVTVSDNTEITQITLPLIRADTITAGNYVLAIYGNSGSNTPGSLVQSLTRTYDTIGTTVSDLNFDVNWTIPTTGSYFLVLHGSGLVGGNIFWKYTNQNGSSAPFFVGFPSNYTVSVDTGATWGTPTLETPQVMRIVVPEPSSYVLAVMGAITLGLTYRRRLRTV